MAQAAIVYEAPARLCIDRAYQYAVDVSEGRIDVCRYTRLAVDRFFRDLVASQTSVFDFVFSEDAAGKFFSFSYKYCRHYQGKWSGQIIDFEPWQCFGLANIFGWVHKDTGYRRFRSVYEEIPRKNGKTTKLGAVGCYMLAGDGEFGAKVYSAATKADQAREVFETIKKMVQKDARLSSVISPQGSKIIYPRKDSEVKLLSAQYNTMDGFNVHAALVDELHAHRDSGMWDVLESGRGSRTQPLSWGITTAGKNPNSFCYEQRGYAIKILEQTAVDDSFFALIYTIDEEDDWKDPAIWEKANPNYGVSVSPEDLENQSRKAQEVASAKNEFLTKRLNVWVYGETVWMNMERWNQCAVASFDETACWDEDRASELDGRDCFGGLDLACVEDLCALALNFEMPDGKLKIICRGYLPEYAFKSRLEKGGMIAHVYKNFYEAGYLVLTPGDVTDYDFIERDIVAACARYNVVEIGFDRFNSSQLVNNLTEQGVPMVAVGMGTASMNAPMKELLRLTLSENIEHNNSLLSFAVSNVVTEENSAGDIRPAKNKVAEKIDPAVAVLLGLARYMAVAEPTYDNPFEEI